jgi:hypothetical protein
MKRNSRPTAGSPGAAGAAAPPKLAGRKRVLAFAGIGVLVLALLALAGWGFWSFLGRTVDTPVNRAQYEALDRKLTAVHDAVTPIAIAFTSQSATTPVDLDSYRAKVAAARKVVTSVNDVQLTSPDAVEIRDMILTGGAQVVDGMDAALTALSRDSTSGADAAAATVEEGLTTLDDAKSRLDQILGVRSTT